MNDSVTLYSCERREISLVAALQTLSDQNMFGLIYTPAWCGLVRVCQGVLNTGPNRLDLAQSFEARLFNQDMELRWLRTPHGRGEGRAVCLTEQSQVLPDWDAHNARIDLERLSGHYLLAGAGCSDYDAPPGWSTLSSAAIGTWHIPLTDLPDRAAAVLHYVEYLGPIDESDGNWAVIDERLLELGQYVEQRQ